jgi:hypothetical protein
MAFDHSDDILTWGQFLMATAEQRRRWRDQLLQQWMENHAQELAEDERADKKRGDWGD